MNQQRDLDRNQLPPQAAPHDDELAPGRASRSFQLTAPEHPLASGLVQRKARDDHGVAADAQASVAAASSSSGAPLPTELRARFEAALGTDLSPVRIHSGTRSAEAATAVGAKAYTVGDDIHFGAGYLDASSLAGQQLLAHEVAHTVQQRGGAPHRQHKLEVSTPGDAAELEADRAAEAMTRGSPVELGGVMGSQLIQRQVGDALATPGPAPSADVGSASPSASLSGPEWWSLPGFVTGSDALPAADQAVIAELAAHLDHHRLGIDDDVSICGYGDPPRAPPHEPRHGRPHAPPAGPDLGQRRADRVSDAIAARVHDPAIHDRFRTHAAGTADGAGSVDAGFGQVTVSIVRRTSQVPLDPSLRPVPTPPSRIDLDPAHLPASILDPHGPQGPHGPDPFTVPPHILDPVSAPPSVDLLDQAYNAATGWLPTGVIRDGARGALRAGVDGALEATLNETVGPAASPTPDGPYMQELTPDTHSATVGGSFDNPGPGGEATAPLDQVSDLMDEINDCHVLDRPALESLGRAIAEIQQRDDVQRHRSRIYSLTAPLSGTPIRVRRDALGGVSQAVQHRLEALGAQASPDVTAAGPPPGPAPAP
jgi:Domain of unknown function (DUF4157)